MIDFNTVKGSNIQPQSTEGRIATKEEVLAFFEDYFKRDVDTYMVYKKTNFKSPNVEIIRDFLSKFENFVRMDSKMENGELVKIAFENIQNSVKILQHQNLLGENDKKMLSFFVAFVVSRFFS